MTTNEDREVAEAIVEKCLPSRSLTHNAELKVAIAAALTTARQEQAERDAVLAETMAAGYQAEAQRANVVENDRPNFWAVRCRTASAIADDIRAAAQKGEGE